MSGNSEYVLEVKNLHTSFFTDAGEVKAVNGVNFALKPGEIMGIVGESGSGKSVTAYSIMQILAETGRIVEGQVIFKGEDLAAWDNKKMRSFRGKHCSIIFQDPMTSLNPVFTIGNQLMEAILLHTDKTKQQAKERAIEMLELVGVNEPTKRIKQYPHELSGGMRQRVMIAMAMSSNPKVLIADEPTTALDVTIQAQILHLLLELQKKNNMSIILITHDLGVVAQTCKRVAVMCGGYVVEEGTVEEIFLNPGHPYTQALIASMPRVGGTFEQFLERDLSDGSGNLCPFLNRCKYADKTCEACLPKYYESSEGHKILCHRREEEK